MLEKTFESPLDFTEIKPANPKGNQPWIFIGRTDAEAKAPILWPLTQRANSMEKTQGRRRRDDRGWDGWMASPTQWTWVWASSRRHWRTEEPGVLQSTGSQQVGHSDWTLVVQWWRLCAAWTSLVVQWIKICVLPLEGVLVWSLFRKLRSHMLWGAVINEWMNK